RAHAPVHRILPPARFSTLQKYSACFFGVARMAPNESSLYEITGARLAAPEAEASTSAAPDNASRKASLMALGLGTCPGVTGSAVLAAGQRLELVEQVVCLDPSRRARS